jgi:tripartite-type tricarboxylate transporter receptor subunit TctC
MKKILITIILVMNFISFGYSKEITLINGQPAGSSTDNLIRMIGEEYEKRFGDKFVQIYQPGGNGKVALAKFNNSSPDHILIGSTAIHIWNFLLDGEKSYANKDFKIVSFIGTGPIFYVSNKDSGIKNIDDLLSKLPKSEKPFISGYANSVNISAEFLQKAGLLDKNVKIVVTKGAPDVVLNVLNGATPVGLVGAGVPNLMTLHKEGKLNVIASTSAIDLEIEGIKIPSMVKKTGVAQSVSGWSLAMNPKINQKEYDKFTGNIKIILTDDKFRKKLLDNHIIVADAYGHDESMKLIENMTESYQKFLK